MTIYVIAGTYSQFKQWYYDFNTKYYPSYSYYGSYPESIRPVRDINDLRGVDAYDARFVLYGTWQERKDMSEIHDMIHHILGQKAMPPYYDKFSPYYPPNDYYQQPLGKVNMPW